MLKGATLAIIPLTIFAAILGYGWWSPVVAAVGSYAGIFAFIGMLFIAEGVAHYGNHK
jgi:hypothetical protein